jgi:hypothetical protein
MDVAALVARLDTLPSLAQVLAADPAGTAVNFDTYAALYTLLQSTVSGAMYPITQREDPTQPSIVCQLAGFRQNTIEGFSISQTDTLVLSVRHAEFDLLIDLIDDIKDALAGAAAAVNVTDAVHEFDDKAQLFVAALEVDYTYLCSASQALPAAFVYCIGRSALPSEYDNVIKQRMDTQYGILLATVAGNMPALAADVMQSLLGWQQTAPHLEMEYSSGASFDGIGGLQLWREIYRDGLFISQL